MIGLLGPVSYNKSQLDLQDSKLTPKYPVKISDFGICFLENQTVNSGKLTSGYTSKLISKGSVRLVWI